MRARTVALVTIALLGVCVLGSAGGSEGFGAPEETIFVSVASYRDRECMETIKHMFAQAKHPARVFVGTCEQNSSDAAEACVPPGGFKYHDNVRRLVISNKDAKGPTYARYLCSTLYRGESYFMQIDSHTKFAKDWDAKAVANLAACPSKKPVLTGYPHDSKTYSLDEKSVPLLCNSHWNADGLPQFTAAIISEAQVAERGGTIPVPFTSGGFIFTAGGVLAEVPYDPSLKQLFQGEEIAYSARLWTSGYDFFTSKDNIVFHHYYREEKDDTDTPMHPKFWNDIKNWGTEQKASASKVRRVLGLEEPAFKPGEYAYGLGKARAVAEYWAFAGLDPAAKTSASGKKFC